MLPLGDEQLFLQYDADRQRHKSCQREAQSGKQELAEIVGAVNGE